MNKDLGQALLIIARNAITTAVDHNISNIRLVENEKTRLKLDQPGAVFVTLTINNQLRGCIGSLQAHRPLREDCHYNAVAAALEDPRFPTLSSDELAQVCIEVSLLSPPHPLPCKSEAEACSHLRPGKDGVIISWHGQRATFLPQVWEQLPSPITFLSSLKKKAGLPGSFWSPDLILQTYEVEHVQEGTE